MRKHLNFTDRTRIRREHARVSLRPWEGDGGRSVVFDLKLDLNPYRRPEWGGCRVRVEAARGNTVQRWDWGTVDVLHEPPEDQRVLREVGVGARFSVFVSAVDGSGRLFALAPSITPEQPVRSLVAVEESSELGEEVWRLDFDDGDVPVLKVNTNIASITEIVRSNASFHALVIPDILRQVLYRAVVIDDAASDDDEPRWTGWLRLAKHYLPNEDPPERSAFADHELDDNEALEAATAWIDKVVAAFAERSMKAATMYSDDVGRS